MNMTSDYPKDHPLHDETNKKVIGKMKDECADTPIAEYICILVCVPNFILF